jgi:hypothetical protein
MSARSVDWTCAFSCSFIVAGWNLTGIIRATIKKVYFNVTLINFESVSVKPMDSCLRIAVLVGFGFQFKSMSRVAKFLSVEKDRMRRPDGDMMIIEEAIDIAMGTPTAVKIVKEKAKPGRPFKSIEELIS